MKTRSLFFIFLACGAMLSAQSLSFEDLLNLQKSGSDKAKGFFSYKGFTWMSSKKECGNCLTSDGYNLNYDMSEWKNGSETIQYLQKTGYANAIIYYTNRYSFEALEEEVKKNLSSSGSGTGDNRMWSTYKGEGLEVTFHATKSKEYYSDKTTYSIIVTRESDLTKLRGQLCSNCKGKGQVVEFKKCYYCSGKGKASCYSCSGKGQSYCQHCKGGQTDCNKCWGKGSTQCSKCWDKGTYQCNKCYGQGSTQCSQCYGQGTMNQSFGSQSFKTPCFFCVGKGKLTCASCSGQGEFKCEKCVGKGNLSCASCVGSGKVSCQYCKGVYNLNCTKCSGRGHTDAVCSSCSGRGVTNEEEKRVCQRCNGTKF